MGAMDHQLGAISEVTYNTPLTVTRFFEYESESIEEEEGRTEGDPLRTGSGFLRADRYTPYFVGASGDVEFAALTKGFGFWLRHMLGASATTGPLETLVYTHTGTEGELLGDSFTMQLNRPFHPSGTNQAFTYAGGKIGNFGISNSVDGNLMLKLGMDFASVSTGTALATAAYPAAMDPFSWAGGKLTIGGSDYDVTEVGIEVDNGLNTGRHQIRQNTTKKEPTSARRSGSVSFKADFDSLTQRNRARIDTRANAAFVGTWRGPTLASATLFPEIVVTIPAVRFDKWKGATEGTDAIEQDLSGTILFDTGSPITVAVKNIDATA